MPSYRYTGWDGSQDLAKLDHDDLMGELSDYLLAQGDVQSALRQMMQRGSKNSPMMGLQELLQRLRNKRQETLDQFDMNSMVDDLRKQLDEVLQTEREGINRRVEAANQRAEERGTRNEERGASSNEGEDALTPEDAQRLSDLLKQIAQQKLDFLNSLPENLGNQLSALSDYDFLDPEAKRQYDEMMDKLRQQVSQSMFDKLQKGMNEMGGQEQQDSLADMLKDLNDLLRQKLGGQDPSQGYQDFKQKWQQQLGPNPPGTLDEMLEGLRQRQKQMQNLMESLSGQQRGDMETLMDGMMGDMDLQQQMAQLAEALSQLMPQERGQRQPFRGDENVDLQQAMHLMQQLGQMEELEKALRRAQYGEGVDNLDPETLRDVLGEEEAQSLEALKSIAKALEEAGYIRREGDRLDLTARGMRKIGQKALADIFNRLKQDRFGAHSTERRGPGNERLDEAKAYEFGDPFFLDLQRTLQNAVERGGPGVPVSLDPKDFEVFRTEHTTQSSTVLMLDLSWSMARRGSFYAAKKVVLALHNLIHTQFPRDSVYIVGFSTYARELKPEQLPYITWDQSEPYTNMQQGFMISQKLLSRHKGGTKQILMISDGEPTAHIERGQIFLGYPPSPRTITETLREVRRCTREGIVINVFMLDKSYYLKDFVDQLTKINRGRAFYTSPETLGQYVMVDYLTGKRRRIA